VRDVKNNLKHRFTSKNNCHLTNQFYRIGPTSIYNMNSIKNLNHRKCRPVEPMNLEYIKELNANLLYMYFMCSSYLANSDNFDLLKTTLCVVTSLNIKEHMLGWGTIQCAWTVIHKIIKKSLI
jgi:hypothetical protein